MYSLAIQFSQWNITDPILAYGGFAATPASPMKIGTTCETNCESFKSRVNKLLHTARQQLIMLIRTREEMHVLPNIFYSIPPHKVTEQYLRFHSEQKKKKWEDI